MSGIPNSWQMLCCGLQLATTNRRVHNRMLQYHTTTHRAAQGPHCFLLLLRAPHQAACYAPEDTLGLLPHHDFPRSTSRASFTSFDEGPSRPASHEHVNTSRPSTAVEAPQGCSTDPSAPEELATQTEGAYLSHPGGLPSRAPQMGNRLLTHHACRLLAIADCAFCVLLF